MAFSTQPQNNGHDPASILPNILFPSSRHDAQVEWTLAQRVFIPTIRYLFLGFVGLILFGVGQGLIIGPWDKAAKQQEATLRDIRTDQSSMARRIDNTETALSNMEEILRRVDLSVAEIKGRISPISSDVDDQESTSPIHKPQIATTKKKPKPRRQDGGFSIFQGR